MMDATTEQMEMEAQQPKKSMQTAQQRKAEAVMYLVKWVREDKLAEGLADFLFRLGAILEWFHAQATPEFADLNIGTVWSVLARLDPPGGSLNELYTKLRATAGLPPD